ncbi:MAG: helix-turn-helix domain-containing protein [Acidimicrobiales bacterium]
MAKDKSRWLSTREACDELGITLRTLYRIINEGKLPCYQFGRVYRLKTDDVDAFLTHARVKPGELAHLYPEPKGAGAQEEEEAEEAERLEPST